MELKRIQKLKSSVDNKGIKPRILYVEDEEMNWAMAHKRLRSGYDLTQAPTSTAVFDTLRATSYDLILMDIQLKGSDLDGMEICRILRGLNTAPPPSYAAGVLFSEPIIFMTAYGARYQRDDLIAAGGNELVTKPVDFATLSLALTRLLMRTLRGENE